MPSLLHQRIMMRKCVILPSARIPSLGTPHLLRRAPGKLAADRAQERLRWHMHAVSRCHDVI
jgi:hypothetical protein